MVLGGTEVVVAAVASFDIAAPDVVNAGTGAMSRSSGFDQYEPGAIWT
jgi:hypothetical protein